MNVFFPRYSLYGACSVDELNDVRKFLKPAPSCAEQIPYKYFACINLQAGLYNELH